MNDIKLKLKVTQCKGEGQGSCKMCIDSGRWNVSWMCFLYRIEGYEGCYCTECARKIMEEKRNETESRDNIKAGG